MTVYGWGKKIFQKAIEFKIILSGTEMKSCIIVFKRATIMSRYPAKAKFVYG
jgi:hypothetical protein